MNKINILGITGSTKSNSSSLAILEFLQKNYQDKIEIKIYDGLSDLPHFNPELEEQLPKSVEVLRQLIRRSDGVLFCTPEYVFSLPGSLKNLIEWNVSTVLFSNKPVAIIIAAASGDKAFASLDLILSTIEAKLPKESKLLIKGIKGKISKEGDILDSGIKKQLDGIISSLIHSIES